MKILIIGSGGREHALGWALRRSPQQPQIFAMPGNPGLARLGACRSGNASDPLAVSAAVDELGIDLVIIGPEAPLVAGVADALRARGVRVFGPSAAAAAIEGSKVFAKELMASRGIPTADFRVIEDAGVARAYAASMRYPHVIKADGLAAGKGALIVRDRAEAERAIESIMVTRCFGEAGARVVFEEHLEGEEMSVFAIAAGEHYQLLPASQDYKRALEGDAGLNTGGMGAYAPVIPWNAALEARVRAEVIEPTLAALVAQRRPYSGLLYAGLMVREGAPKVIEYNCRFGDPETQALVPILSGDLLEGLWAASDRNASVKGLPPLGHDGRFAACVVVAAAGYPGRVRTGDAIDGSALTAERDDEIVFEAGTALRDGRLVTAGGRVLNAVGVAADLPGALERAYAAAARVSFAGAHFRRDIAWRGLEALGGARRA
jgi:phosphoribosylamine---glycine ligase